jgi:hypothetical protein
MNTPFLIFSGNTGNSGYKPLDSLAYGQPELVTALVTLATCFRFNHLRKSFVFYVVGTVASAVTSGWTKYVLCFLASSRRYQCYHSKNIKVRNMRENFSGGSDRRLQ